MEYDLDPLTGDPMPRYTKAATDENAILPDLTDDQLRKLAREKLSMALQAIDPTSQPEMTRKLCAELMDRLDGKPAQSVTMDATLRTVTVNAHITFAEPHMVIEHNTTSSDGSQLIEDKG